MLDLPPYTGAVCLLTLTALCALLARRGPAWRRLAWCLAALALLDVARLVTLPRAALRAWGWWQADVALVAMWPAVMVAALRAASLRPEPRVPLAPDHQAHPIRLPGVRRRISLPVAGAERTPTPPGAPARSAGEGADVIGGTTPSVSGHRLNLTTLVLLCYALCLGIARPYLPAPLYLGGLVVPRVVLAGVWLAAVWRVATKGEGPGSLTLRARDRASMGGAQPVKSPAGERSEGSASAATGQGLPALAALLLASGDVAAALVAWSPVLRGGRPAWEAAQGVTLASYGMVAAVIAWALRRRG